MPALPLTPPTAALLHTAALQVRRHEHDTLPRLRRLWQYYRNPEIGPAAGTWSSSAAHPRPRRPRLAQEQGLPARLTGARPAPGGRLADDRIDAVQRKEVVIENDIAWRLHTMVDFLVGRPVEIRSTAADPALRSRIDAALDAVWRASGGLALLQDAALLSHIYGHADLIVRTAPPALPAPRAPHFPPAPDADPTAFVRVDAIEPTRGLALLNPADYRHIDAYVLRTHHARAHEPADNSEPRPRAAGLLHRVLNLGWLPPAAARAAHPLDHGEPAVVLTELLAHGRRWLFHADDRDDASPLGRLIDAGPFWPAAAPDIEPATAPDHTAPLPVVHIQNLSQPFAYHGLSEVEPLIPLQDELNTRLSDRASRVTLQSFKMYLAKGLDGFDRGPVGPGTVWATDNPDAQITSFGGDAASPSEDRHIDEIREALDKASSVPPLAAGVVRAKIGNLTSENALRVTLLGLLSKTARKRITFGRGLEDASRLILHALDSAGVLPTSPDQRGVRILWPDPLPRDERDVLDAALRKVELGVPRERILAELGYSPEP